MKRLLGERLWLARKDLGLTQSELGRRAGVSSSYVSRIERGEIENVGVETLQALARVLDVSLAYLLGESDIATPEGPDMLEEATPIYVVDSEERQLVRMLLDAFQKLSRSDQVLMVEIGLRFLRASQQGEAGGYQGDQAAGTIDTRRRSG